MGIFYWPGMDFAPTILCLHFALDIAIRMDHSVNANGIANTQHSEFGRRSVAGTTTDDNLWVPGKSAGK